MGGRGSYGRGGGGDGGGCGGSDGLGGGGGGGGGDWQSAAAATATTAAAANLPRVRQWRRRQSAVEGLAVAIAVAAAAFPQRLMPAVAAVAAPSIAAAASAAVAEAVAATGGTLEEAVDWRRRAATSKWRLHVAIAVADHTFAVAAVSAALAPPTPPPPPLPLTLAVASVRPSARCPPRFGGLCWREWEGVTTWSELLLLSLPLPQRVPLGLSALPLLLPLPLLSPLQSRITSPPPPSSTVRRPCRFYCRRGWGAGGRHGRGHCERGRLFLAAAATATAAAATASANATPTTPAAAIAAATGASVAVPLRSFADGHLLTLATAEGGVPTLPLTNAARTAVSDNVGGRHVGAGRRRCNWLFVGARSDFGGAGADSQGRRKRVPPLGKVVALGGEGRAGERRGDVVHGIRGHRGQRRGGHASY